MRRAQTADSKECADTIASQSDTAKRQSVFQFPWSPHDLIQIRYPGNIRVSWVTLANLRQQCTHPASKAHSPVLNLHERIMRNFVINKKGDKRMPSHSLDGTPYSIGVYFQTQTWWSRLRISPWPQSSNMVHQEANIFKGWLPWQWYYWGRC